MIFMSKGQVEIITAVLIVVIAIGLTSAAYTWGIPLIQKRQHEALAERVKNAFDQTKSSSLPNRIEFIANAGSGGETFSLDVDGLWNLNETEDSIQFAFFSKVSNIAVDDWMPLTQVAGASCPPSRGIRGEKSSIVCAKAEKFADGYNIYYKVWFRKLDDLDGNRVFQIDLIQARSSNSTSKSFGILFEKVRQEPEGQKTLIATEIKILL